MGIEPDKSGYWKGDFISKDRLQPACQQGQPQTWHYGLSSVHETGSIHRLLEEDVPAQRPRHDPGLLRDIRQRPLDLHTAAGAAELPQNGCQERGLACLHRHPCVTMAGWPLLWVMCSSAYGIQSISPSLVCTCSEWIFAADRPVDRPCTRKDAKDSLLVALWVLT